MLIKSEKEEKKRLTLVNDGVPALEKEWYNKDGFLQIRKFSCPW